MPNMFQKNSANTINEYLAAVPPERQEIINFFHNFIQKSGPSLKPFFSYNMLGYGKFQYTNNKKEVLDWPVVALANQKHYISIYICSIVDGEYLAEKAKDKLGKVSVGRSCIRFKKLEDINLTELKKVIQTAAKNPGLK